jgi:hypothetical protein
MKLSIGLLLTAISASMASSSGEPITADSKMGLKLLKHARQLEGDDGENNAQDYYQADTTWMEDYSLKFIGCHQVAQWNENADEEEDAVRIQTQRYVRFRLCQSQHCVADRAVGCSSSYGDYVVDMDTFVAAHLENQQDILESNCETQAETCGCDDDQENCLSNCYYDAGMSQCVDGQNDLEFLEKYATCTAYENEGNDRRRELNDAEGGEAEEEYYIGPYCADQGGEVVLGMFTDNTCTSFADAYGGTSTYAAMTGSSLPYSETSMIDGECYSCKQASEDYYGEYEVSGLCADNYEVSGKCETELRHHLSSVNRNACNWIHGIQITPIHSNGIIHARYHGSPKAAMAIASFATLFVILAFYVSYLNSQLAMKKACDIASYREGRRSRSPNKYRKIKKRFSFSKLFKKKNKKTSESLL